MPVKHSVKHGRKHMFSYLITIIVSALISEIFKTILPNFLYWLDRFSDTLRYRLHIYMPARFISVLIIGIGIAFCIGLVHGYNDWKDRQVENPVNNRRF